MGETAETKRRLTGRKVGYMRISTKRKNQSLTMQKVALEKYGCDRIFSDKGISGTKFPRKGLSDALNAVDEGDTLVVWQQSRLGRDPEWMEKLQKRFRGSGIHFHALMQPFDIYTSHGRFMYRIQAAVDANEVENIAERTAWGMEAHKAKGSRFGRKLKLSRDDVIAAKTMIEFSGVSIAAVAGLKKVSVKTLKRAMKRFEDGGYDAC